MKENKFYLPSLDNREIQSDIGLRAQIRVGKRQSHGEVNSTFRIKVAIIPGNGTDSGV